MAGAASRIGDPGTVFVYECGERDARRDRALG
jgi:hypothetical protein